MLGSSQASRGPRATPTVSVFSRARVPTLRHLPVSLHFSGRECPTGANRYEKQRYVSPISLGHTRPCAQRLRTAPLARVVLRGAQVLARVHRESRTRGGWEMNSENEQSTQNVAATASDTKPTIPP